MKLLPSYRLARWVTLAFLATAGAVLITAPLLAVWWSARPFPGFVVEQSLVVSDNRGHDWAGLSVGLQHPERVIGVADVSINSLAQFKAAIASFQPGQYVQIRTILPSGLTKIYEAVRIDSFPTIDFVRLFSIPYAIGLIFFIAGIWVYRIRGDTLAGRAYAFFCACATIATGLLFDLVSTHIGTVIWTIAITQAGGALISLALLFPEEWPPVTQRSWLRLIPYSISAVLVIWGLQALTNEANPWAYILAWRFSYIYAAVGIVFFLVVMVFRGRSAPSAVAKAQARAILLGSLLGFTPVGIWLGAPIFGEMLHWDPTVFLPFLLIFPLSVAVAILRYRLWDVDIIIHRTLVYGVLTLILGLIYIVSVVILEQVFRSYMGWTSRIAAAGSTLAIVLLFNPLRQRVQETIDLRFYRRKYNVSETLGELGSKIRDEVDLTKLIDLLENVVVEAIQPAHLLIWLATPKGYQVYLAGEEEGWGDSVILSSDPLVNTLRNAAGAVELGLLELQSPGLDKLRSSHVEVVAPLVSQGELIGWFTLGEHLSELDYSTEDRILLSYLADQAAPAVRVAQLTRQQQAEALERERLNHELKVARSIQQTLLPKELPILPGWQAAAHYQPARAVGGDFYDFIPLPEGQIALIVGDVSDKGIPAALVMASTRALIRGSARRLKTPREVLERANELLHPEIPAGIFVTCLYALLDPASGKLRFANAGHNLPCLYSNGEIADLQARGMPLGLMPGMHYEEQETCLSPEDCVLFYSDGLTEAHNSYREMFGHQRLHEMMQRHRGDCNELIRQLLGELSAFAGEGWEQEDDVTMVALQRLPVGNEIGSQDG